MTARDPEEALDEAIREMLDDIDRVEPEHLLRAGLRAQMNSILALKAMLEQLVKQQQRLVRQQQIANLIEFGKISMAHPEGTPMNAAFGEIFDIFMTTRNGRWVMNPGVADALGIESVGYEDERFGA